jgi:hypothetical protein
LEEQTELGIERRKIEAILVESRGKGLEEFGEALKSIVQAENSIIRILELVCNGDFEELDLEIEGMESEESFIQDQEEGLSFEELNVYGVRD